MLEMSLISNGIERLSLGWKCLVAALINFPGQRGRAAWAAFFAADERRSQNSESTMKITRWSVSRRRRRPPVAWAGWARGLARAGPASPLVLAGSTQGNYMQASRSGARNEAFHQILDSRRSKEEE